MSRWLWADIKGRVVNLDRVESFVIEKGLSHVDRPDRWHLIAVLNAGRRLGVFQGDTEEQCHEWLSRQLAVDDARVSL